MCVFFVCMCGWIFILFLDCVFVEDRHCFGLELVLRCQQFFHGWESLFYMCFYPFVIFFVLCCINIVFYFIKRTGGYKVKGELLSPARYKCLYFAEFSCHLPEQLCNRMMTEYFLFIVYYLLVFIYIEFQCHHHLMLNLYKEIRSQELLKFKVWKVASHWLLFLAELWLITSWLIRSNFC